MLDLVVDVKNNRSRDKKSGGGGGGGSSPIPTLAPAVSKWLKSTGVETQAVGGISWAKVLNKSGRKGEWWLPTAADAAVAIAAAQASLRNNNYGGSTSTGTTNLRTGGGANNLMLPEILDEKRDAAQEAALLKLAATMRMNTETKKSIFVIVMGSDDCMDAFEKLLRLNLKGTQERDIVKVILDCCLQEQVFNPYYSLLLKKLCDSGKGHKMTLQYSLWDLFKEISSFDVRKITNLAKLTASVISGFSISSTTLKVVDFTERFSAKEALFWRLFFKHFFLSVKKSDDLGLIFGRIVAQPQLAGLKTGIVMFLKTSVGPWLANKDPKTTPGGEEKLAVLLKRCRSAEKILSGK